MVARYRASLRKLAGMSTRSRPDADLHHDDLSALKPLTYWCRHWPGRVGGRPLDLATIHRWALHGLRGAILRTHRVPGCGRCATAENVLEFVRAVDSVGRVEVAAPAPQKSRLDALARFGLARGQETSDDK